MINNYKFLVKNALKERKVKLNKFSSWDPMLLHDGKRWLLYVLTTNEIINQDNFFTQDNYIHGFASENLNSWNSWNNLNQILKRQNMNERVCAGSLIKENGIIYFFYSYTKEITKEILDQKILLATSVDGLNFKFVPEFSLLPDEIIYATNCKDPETGKMVFAWRDPYIFKDPKSDKYFLFICAGGDRWGIPPQVPVAVADSVAGTYKLLPSATKLEVNINNKLHIPFKEIERVQVIYYQDKYYMFFHCWKCYVSQEFITLCENMGYQVTNSTIYVLYSEDIIGPYKIDLQRPIVIGSERTRLYGTFFIPSSESKEEYFVTGWYHGKFKIEVSKKFRLLFKEGNWQVLHNYRYIMTFNYFMYTVTNFVNIYCKKIFQKFKNKFNKIN